MSDDAAKGRDLKTTLISMVLGVVLVIVAYSTLSWNEQRSTQAVQKQQVAFKAVPRQIDATPINPANQGKLIYVTGQVNTSDELADPGFDVTKIAIKLTRSAKMYQWQQQENVQSGSGSTKVTTVDFKKVWSDKVIDSSKFSFQGGASIYDNPKSIAIPSRVAVAKEVKIGDFKLSPELIKAIPNAKLVDMQHADIEKIRKRFKTPVDINHAGPDIFIGGNPDSPAIGDIKVSITAVSPQIISIVAMQSNNRLIPFNAGSGKGVFFIRAGVVPSDQMIPKVKLTNVTGPSGASWLYRVVGLVLMTVGLMALFISLSGFSEKIAAYVGGQAGTKLALMMGVVLTVLTIAYSGFAQHPWISVLLVIVLMVAGYFGFLGRKKKE